MLISDYTTINYVIYIIPPHFQIYLPYYFVYFIYCIIYFRMPLLYSCVAYGSVVLADHADVVGNFETATQQILDRTDADKFSRHTYSVNQ